MKRRITVFTGSRAEYGLLQGLMKSIAASSQFELQIIASGMHLSPEFGETWKVIEDDGFHIDAKVEMLLSSNTSIGTAKSMGLGTIGFADALARLQPDLLIVLGDRFEALAVAQAALVMNIPIAHIHGGEISEGAYDDAIRHAITKMACLHFTAAEPYRKRVIQLGENPAHVHQVGAVGVDQILDFTPLTLDQLSQCLGFPLKQPYFVVTYHPVTVGNEDPVASFAALLEALDSFPDHQVIITHPNADHGGRSIIALIEHYAQPQPARVLALPSLGTQRYGSALKYCEVMIGNSSSGLIEAPACHKPSVNIGIRQQGRLAAESVIQCTPDSTSIAKAIATALSADFQMKARQTVNPYGSGQATARIMEILQKPWPKLPKRFHDLPI